MPQWSHWPHWHMELGQEWILGATNYYVQCHLLANEPCWVKIICRRNVLCTLHKTENHIQCLLYKTKLLNADNLLKYLDTLKSYCDRINRFPNAKFHILDTHFNAIISASLPSLWHTYVEPYNGNANDPNNSDPKWHLPSDTFIGLLWEEYKVRLTRSNNGNNKNGTNGSVNLVKTQNTTSTSKSLADWLTDHKILLRAILQLLQMHQTLVEQVL